MLSCKRRNVLLFALLSIALAACAGSGAATTASALPASPTLPPPTAVIVTAVPTATPTVTPTAAPSATSTPIPISVENANQLSSQGLAVGGTPIKVAWSPDATSLAVITADALLLYDSADLLAEPRHLETYPGGGQDVTFSPDGNYLASAGDGIHVWRRATGVEEISIPGAGYTSLGFSPDSTLLAIGNIEGKIALIEVSSGQVLAQLTSGFTIWSVAFSPDGTLLASGGVDSRIWLWDVSKRRSLNTIEVGWEIKSLAFSPDGILIASGSDDGLVRLWSVVSAQQMVDFKGHEGKVLSVAFHPSDLILASGGADGTLRLWDIVTGQDLVTLMACTGGEVLSVAWSPDGALIAAAGSDGKVTLWSVPPAGTVSHR